MKKVSMILATDKNGAIGFDGDLVIRNKQDLQRFKRITKGKAIVMGRKTFESLPKLLSDRFHMVITSRTPPLPFGYKGDGLGYYRSLDHAIECSDGEEVIIIGGGQIYNEAIIHCKVDRIYHTLFDYEVENADAWFNLSQFNMDNGIFIGNLPCYVNELSENQDINVYFNEYRLKQSYESCEVTK